MTREVGRSPFELRDGQRVASSAALVPRSRPNLVARFARRSRRPPLQWPMCPPAEVQVVDSRGGRRLRTKRGGRASRVEMSDCGAVATAFHKPRGLSLLPFSAHVDRNSSGRLKPGT